MSSHRIPSRPHLQGNPAPLQLRHSARKLTDGAGRVLLRRLWDRWDLGRSMDDLKLVAARGMRRLFGYETVPDPTTFGRWLRRAAPVLVPLLDELVRQLVRARWTDAASPSR